MLRTVSAPIADLTAALTALKAGMDAHGGDTAAEEAAHAQSLLALMDDVRWAADTLENLVADDLWPLPTYQEMLYIL
jgi:glutamine synthetase